MKYVLLAFLLLEFACPARADSDLEIIVKGGASGGTVFTPNDTGGTLQKYTIGCFGVETGMQKSISPKYAVELDYGILLDTVNSQVSRQGVEGGLIYHLSGGARTVKQGDDNVQLVSTSQSQISLLLFGSSQSYSFAAKDLNLTISGSVNEAKFGIYVRRNNWGAQLLLPLISISSSNSQLTTRITDFSLFYLL